MFLHIRKTAGTSIVRMAMDHYGHENICSHGDYMGKPPSELEKFSFISGHFGFDYAQELMAERFSFTFLRNPVDRILSLYCFCRTRDPEEFPIYRAAAENDLDGFLVAASDDDLIRSYISNSQVWCLATGPGLTEIADDGLSPKDRFDCALENAGAFSYIGFLETFDEDAKAIMAALNIPTDASVRHENITPHKISDADLPDSTRQLLKELTQWDQKLYEILFKKYKGNARS